MLNNKCVIVIDHDLPVGVIANTAAVLSLSIGKQFPALIGRDLKDCNGDPHHGITTTALPILKGSAGSLKDMRAALKQFEPAVTVIDLTSATQTTKNYDDYADKLATTPVEQLEYLGLAIYGDTKIVNKFTGSLGLLR